MWLQAQDERINPNPNPNPNPNRVWLQAQDERINELNAAREANPNPNINPNPRYDKNSEEIMARMKTMGLELTDSVSLKGIILP